MIAYNELINSLSGTLDRVRRYAPSHADQLNAVVRRLNSPAAIVTFGGRFNAGKSSVVNACLGRRLLPTGEFAETGGNCHLISGILNDALLVWKNKPRERIACSPEAIKEAITLRGGLGRLKRLSELNYLEIQLRNFPGGTAARWIDPPGLFDQEEMTPYALAALRDADVVIWVLRSQQFLAEREMEGLAEHIEEHGSASVVFVENAFMVKDNPAPWDYHQRVIAPVNRGKLMHLAKEMGLSDDQKPTLVSVSAQKMLEGAAGFGEKELIALLESLKSPDRARIRKARLQWTEIVLRRLIADLEADLGKKMADIAERQRKIDERKANAMRVKARMSKAVAAEVDAFCTQFESAANRCGSDIAGGISKNVIHRDGTYQIQLNSNLKKEMDSLLERLIAQLDREADRLGAVKLTRKGRVDLQTALALSEVQVAVPNSGVGGSVAAGAATGAVAGSFIPILGTFFGAVAGAVAAGMAGAAAANEKDAAQARSNVLSAAQSVAYGVVSRKDKALQILSTHYQMPAQTDEATTADRQRHQELQQLCNELKRAAQTAVDLSRKVGV